MKKLCFVILLLVIIPQISWRVWLNMWPELREVARCESTFNPKAIGDNGKAKGLFQYHQKTWNRFSKESGIKGNPLNPYDAILMTIWAFEKGYQNHWTCWKA